LILRAGQAELPALSVSSRLALKAAEAAAGMTAHPATGAQRRQGAAVAAVFPLALLLLLAAAPLAAAAQLVKDQAPTWQDWSKRAVYQVRWGLQVRTLLGLTIEGVPPCTS